VQTDIGCLPDNPVKFAEKVYGVGMGILGGLALLAIMYGGYQIVTSAGNMAKVDGGKKYIYYALGALGLGIFGLVLFQMISTNTFHIPGFS
jgi:TRAP-type C4-dicarboxylate transport system permease small subunit